MKDASSRFVCSHCGSPVLTYRGLYKERLARDHKGIEQVPGTPLHMVNICAGSHSEVKERGKG